MRVPGRASRRLRRSRPNVSGGGHAWGAVCSHFPRTRLATPRHAQAVTAQGQSRHSVRVNPTMASWAARADQLAQAAQSCPGIRQMVQRRVRHNRVKRLPPQGNRNVTPSRPGTVPGHGRVPGRRRRSRPRAGHDVPDGQRGSHHRSPRRGPTSLRQARTHPASRHSECWRSTARPCRPVCLWQPKTSARSESRAHDGHGGDRETHLSANPRAQNWPICARAAMLVEPTLRRTKSAGICNCSS